MNNTQDAIAAQPPIPEFDYACPQDPEPPAETAYERKLRRQREANRRYRLKHGDRIRAMNRTKYRTRYAAYRKKYAAAHREEIAARSKRRYDAKREEIRAKAAEYRKKNRERLRLHAAEYNRTHKARAAEYRKRTKKARAAYARQYQNTHRDQLRERLICYRRKNRDKLLPKWRAYDLKVRAELRSSYVRQILSRYTRVPLYLWPESLVELKRAQMALHRKVKEHGQAL